MKKIILLIVMLLVSIPSAVTLQAETSINNTLPTTQENYLDINELSTFNNVVVFIRFADEENYTSPYGYNYYENLFNGVDQVSLRDFFLEASYNQLEINLYLVNENNVVLYYTDIHNRGYFQPYDASSNPEGYDEINRDQREHDLLKRAVDYIDAENLIPDNLNLDYNDDGDVDSITFMISGEDNGWNSLLWPHKWELSSYYNYSSGEYKVGAPMINGKYIYTYTFELLGNDTSYNYKVDVGVLAHETFHLISATDLYHYYDYDWIDPVGYWGLMSSVDEVPSHMLGYMKEAYGEWITDVTEITDNGTYTLYPQQDSPNNLYKISTGTFNEYIYIEYRDSDGLYESTLPSTGLIVYRVDYDQYDIGNIYGYYGSDDESNEEVFVFRPGLYDNIFPIEFPDYDDEYIDEDGNIDGATLSQYNPYDAIGQGTSFLMFSGDGSEIEVQISNIFEHDGYITFDVSFGAATIDLVTDYAFAIPEMILIDLPNTSYKATISNLEDDVIAYYTTDGSEPSNSDTLFVGQEIPLTATNNTIKVAIYRDGLLINTLEKSFEFSSIIETSHPYSVDSKTYVWYLNFDKLTDYNLSFNSESDLGTEGDTMDLFVSNDYFTTYNNNDVKDLSIDYVNNGIMIIYGFPQDEFTYGLHGEFEINIQFDSLGYYLNGEKELTLDITSETYVEEGVSIVGEGSDKAYYTTSGTVDSNIVGDYTITYDIYDEFDDLVVSLERIVHIADLTAPIVTLEGSTDITIEVGEDFIEPGYTVYDNYSVTADVTVNGYLDTTQPNDYVIFYSVTDDAGNVSEPQIRTIHVIDTIDPTGELNPGLDTLTVGDTFTDAGVTGYDNHKDLTRVVVEGTVDTTTPGTYKLTYLISDYTGNTISLERYVTVKSDDIIEQVEFKCEASKSTIQVGESIKDPKCIIDHSYVVEYDFSDVDTTTPGTYPIYVSRDVYGVVHTYRTYVFVVAAYEFDTTLYFEKKEEELV